MSLEALDQLLAAWDERLERIDATLLALEAEPTYQMLAPRSATRAPLDGVTAQVVGPALDALAELFEHRGRLTEVLDRAKAVRASMSSLAFWGGDEKEREIAALLDGPSIPLPAEVTPLARRALLDPAGREVRVAPEQLLGAMIAAYERARDAVFSVKEAWARAEGEIERIERDVVATRASAKALGVEATVLAELGTIERELDSIRSSLARDPLGSGSLGASLVLRLAVASSGLSAISGQKRRVEEGLARARADLVELRGLHAAARAACAELPREVEHAAAPGSPVDDAAIEDLGVWLDRIEKAAHAGRWATAEVGLGPWGDARQSTASRDAPIAAALVALVARRDELIGRLGARRAQAEAISARGTTLAPSAQAMADEAEALLALRPTPLARASELVDSFEALVREARRRSGA